MKYTYLLVDIFTIIIPFIFTFHKKLNFHRYWKSFWIANILVAVPFLIWDVIFTKNGIWGFNEPYLTGIFFLNLPIEEYLFFIAIPYACVFTWHCFNVLGSMVKFNRVGIPLTLLIIANLLFIGISNSGKMYTSITFFTLAALFIFLLVAKKGHFLGRFLMTYIVLLIPFFMVNGVLTGTGLDEPIVWYNDAENLGFRILTIPVEDIFYGMLLILLNILLFEWLKKRWQT